MLNRHAGIRAVLSVKMTGQKYVHAGKLLLHGNADWDFKNQG